MGKKDKRRRADPGSGSDPHSGSGSAELTARSGPAPTAPAPLQPEWTEALTAHARGRLTGARMCFGKPVHAAGLTVVPVASVRSLGGGGLSMPRDRADSPADSRTAGTPPIPGSHDRHRAGYLHARPLGFIEIGPEGARYRPLDRHARGVRAMAAGLALVGGLLAAGTLLPRFAGRPSLRPLRAIPSPLPRRSTRR